jgi:transposase
MTLRAKGARKRRGNSPRPEAEGTVTVAVLDRDGEAVGPSFTIAASQEGVVVRVRTLAARGATAAQTLLGLEAAGHRWENLEAALVGAGYRVLVVNPLQTRRYRDVVRRKAKTDDIDAHLIAGLLRSGVAQASYVPDEQIQSLRELARLRARLMADRQDYQRQLIAQLDVVLPEHHAVLGDLLTARARGILAQFPTAQHLAQANPRAIRRAAEDAGARGFSLNDATVVRDSARRSLYSGKAAVARAHVVRTLVNQLERLINAMDEVDRAATALLPPSEPGTGPSDAELLQTIPGIGPQTAATLLGELGALTRFTDARALVAYVGFYPVLNESGDRAATPRLSRVGSRIARRSLYLAAVNAVRRSGEWRTIYLRKKAQGKTAKQALVVVAVKLIHALYAMLKHRQPYNPSRLLVAPATIGT